MKAQLNTGKWEAACDEVGRGCIAGPVFAAAVLFAPDQVFPNFIQDSKKLSETKREVAFEWIQTHAVSWCIAMQGPRQIDKLNILWASVKAMHLALDGLTHQIDSILIDGNKFVPYKSISHHCVVKGDSKFYSIAAASILAKVSRDWWMQKAAIKVPYYDWENNKGYPTKKHKNAIEKFGIHPLHRRSFKLIGNRSKIKEQFIL